MQHFIMVALGKSLVNNVFPAELNQPIDWRSCGMVVVGLEMRNYNLVINN